MCIFAAISNMTYFFMKKTFLFLALLQAGFAMAGDLLTNTNQSVHFLRNPARDASTEIDAVYTNPAGLVKLDEGFHFSISNQSAYQTRSITSNSRVFQYSNGAYNAGDSTKTYEGTASVAIIPSIMAAYKKGKWVLSGSVAVAGGGGKATFNNGLPAFENLIGSTTAILTNNTGYLPFSDDQYMKGSSFNIGAQLGGTYQINDCFSAYLGFRMNMVHNKYLGYIKNFQVATLGDATNATYNSVLTTVNTQIAALSAAGQAIPAVLYSAQAGASLAAMASSNDGLNVNVSQTGWGVAPILGFDYNLHDRLNIGAKYEFKTSLNLENDIDPSDNSGMYKDGVNTPYDIPAYFAVGVAYKITPQLSGSVGYHHFFDSKAKMEDDKQKYAGSTNEYLGGLEYQINDMLLVSAGGQITRYGVGDQYQSNLSFACDSYSLGFGGSIKVAPKVKINIAYFWTNYQDYNKVPGGGVTLSGTEFAKTNKDVFSRTNKVFGAGVDFSF